MFITNALRTRQRNQLETALSRVPAHYKATYPVSEEVIRKALLGFSGRLVFKGDPNYEADRKGNSMYPELAWPFVIAYCASASDVSECLAFARVARLPFTIRGGGHSNAGYSVDSGMVLDVSLMNSVHVAWDQTRALVGSGANLGTVYQALDRYGLHVPGGECDSVGVAGHSMGGGYGFTSRIFGLNCDAVESVRLMLADGRTVMADKTVNPDLFWAVRGGTGNQFGVLLEIQYRAVPLPPIWAFVLTWPLARAPEALVAIQANYIQGFDPEMGYQLAIGRNTNGREVLCMMGMYNGDGNRGESLLAPLRAIGDCQLQSQVGLYSAMNEWLLSWYELPAPLETTTEVKQSNFIARPLSLAEWRQVIAYYQTKPTQYDMVAFEVYGGRATNPGVDSAYIHRDVHFDMFIDSFSNPAWPVSPEQADRWVQEFDALMQPFSNGHKYQNYPNRHNLNYRWNYWGDVFNSLLFVKNKYDPGNVFNYQQGITPYPDDTAVRKSNVPSQFSDPTITYEQGQSMSASR